MIKTYLSHFILDKFISHVFDGFIGTFHKPRNFYTKDDFHVGQPINTLVIEYHTYIFDSGSITRISDSSIRITYNKVNVYFNANMNYENSHINASHHISFINIIEIT